MTDKLVESVAQALKDAEWQDGNWTVVSTGEPAMCSIDDIAHLLVGEGELAGPVQETSTDDICYALARAAILAVLEHLTAEPEVGVGDLQAEIKATIDQIKAEIE